MAHRGTYNTRVSVRHSIRADAGNKSFNKILKFIFDPIKGYSVLIYINVPLHIGYTKWRLGAFHHNCWNDC